MQKLQRAIMLGAMVLAVSSSQAGLPKLGSNNNGGGTLLCQLNFVDVPGGPDRYTGRWINMQVSAAGSTLDDGPACVAGGGSGFKGFQLPASRVGDFLKILGISQLPASITISASICAEGLSKTCQLVGSRSFTLSGDSGGGYVAVPSTAEISFSAYKDNKDYSPCVDR
ncbi:MAG: hypothetical protein A3F10_07415 [Coxiella sp. RIFCSPHIGHO2_12_FULL_42_15]|nr:MAG: hypothetical protein A3F10_07415 [Coxiella sp. RIFCSPHIGHO2_12_FULL_42_15]